MVFSASELQFDTAAQPTTLVLGEKEMLRSGSSPGFTLHYSDGAEVREIVLNMIATSGNKIKVSHPDGQPSFIFQIDTYAHHLAIHLLRAQGIGTGRNVSLNFALNSTDLAAYTLNDLMTVNTGNRRRKETVLSLLPG